MTRADWEQRRAQFKPTAVVTLVTVALAVVPGLGSARAAAGENIVWHNASELTVEGRGWNDTSSFYYRLPQSAQARVTPAVWDLASNTAGMAVRFTSDADSITARWTLTSANLAMNHMAATGVSGLDLYVRHQGRWHWLATGRPAAQSNEVALVGGLTREQREFLLYLPLYNGLSALELGVPKGATIAAAPSPKSKPIVFYGTSITQGGCASRPGMACPAIIGRKLDVATINLGFSGNGRAEHEVADLLAQLDPAVYVIDPLPNMDEAVVDDRLRYLLGALRRAHPATPVILVENVIYQDAFIRGWPGNPKNRLLEKICQDLAPAWNGQLHYVKGDALVGSDGEGTVDGVHATDLGFLRMAEVLSPVIQAALGRR